ncbi:hypothetical protein K470DRAFT_256672 [Piedraia hortae CBS 480.64]|uniref:Gamma interferon inducible lysosomal thiol reductase n=1 Tax=Piedraia hortae CBS 480.64 TaxID=1314780 RepID=A0A6A7C2U5_9PEZI|nr:hypothetical protein K470DRAFT_256672 [Piedraia hortae CBS 480.64]
MALILCFWILSFVIRGGLSVPSPVAWYANGKTPSRRYGSPAYGTSKIPMDIYIMSKCPDARDCMQMLILPTMQNVSDIIDLNLSYIGTENADGSVTCKHGPTECQGNIIELCAAQINPDPKTILGFTMCMYLQYPLIPNRELVESCALQHWIPIEKLDECTSRDNGEFGMSLLRKSVAKSAEDEVKISCTVKLEGKTVCVRDGGEWVDCPRHEPQELEDDIKKLAGKQ